MARAAVIGAGLMGHGIAQVLALGGLEVTVHDAAPDALAAVRDKIAANLAATGDPRRPDIHLTDDLSTAVTHADWVFEAVPENLELKRELFARLDTLAAPEAILATNTSVLRVGDVAAAAQRRGRILGTHWWNPPFLIPLVEVVQGPDTEPDTVTRTMALLTTLGKTPVHVRRDVAGFIGNRLQHALWREAFDLVDTGVCDAETVDTVIKSGFGLRLPVLGPIENADLVGLDLTLAIHEYVLPQLHPPSEPAAGLRERVAAGRLGMKTGAGYRTWTDHDAAATRERVITRLTSTTPQKVTA
ncbi:MAG TPA: 3-hydroxyacyl-CoA dehydrogenase family protein [Solirubrobacteraceae bacterium]|nr:3-hydroxyacyl-CoA dehydrogenase family protein [Solirubrobacteraceae bacterium]